MTQSMVVYEQFDAVNGYYKTYQRTYEVSSDGKVTLGADVQEVTLMTNILPVANSQPAKGTEPAANKESDMTDKTKTPETPAAQVDPNAPAANATAPAAPAAPQAPIVHKTTNDQGELEVTMNEKGEPTGFKFTPKIQAAASTAPAAQTLEQLLANANPALRESIESGVKLHTERKTNLIAALKATNRCKFNDDQLKAMSLDMLEQLGELAQVPSYAGVAGPAVSSNAVDDNAAPPAPNVFEFPAPAAAKTA